jgi:hypothetical protein
MPSVLRFGDKDVLSEEGAQQGDPLGPLFFCLTIHNILSSLKSELVTGYLDDVGMGGEATVVANDFLLLEKEAAKHGLLLNRSKCEVAGHSAATRSVFTSVGITLSETAIPELILLGSPLQQGAKVDETLASKREELETMVGRLQFMPAHDNLFLLRNVVTSSRLLYTLRTSPCVDSPVLDSYDKLVRSTLSKTINVDITDAGWAQASLPVRWGGLGVRSAVMLASSAYLASAAGTSDLVFSLLPQRLQLVPHDSIARALNVWSASSGSAAPLAPLSTRQRSWDEPCCQRVFDALLNASTDDVSRARIRASSHCTSGAWLETLPVASIGLKMEDEVVRVAVGLRLGLNLCEPHTCQCGAQVDARGIHGLACKKSAGRHPRHGLLNDVVWRAMQRAQVPSTKEPVGLSRSDGKRPDGVSLIPWAHGRCLTWDVTSPDTFAPSHLHATSLRAGAAAQKAEATKTAKYSTIALTHVFVPLAFETLGAWGEDAIRFVTNLGRRISAVTGEPRETTFLRQRLSVAIQRGNRIACRGTVPQANYDA